VKALFRVLMIGSAVVFAGLGAGGCSGGQPVEQPAEQASETPTIAPLPTAISTATPAANPTATPTIAPTATSVPTPTPSPRPTGDGAPSEWPSEGDGAPSEWPSEGDGAPSEWPSEGDGVPSEWPSEGDGVVNGWAVLVERDYYSEYGWADLPVDYINIVRVHQLLLDLGWSEDHIRELREFDQQDLREGLDWLASNADADDLAYVHVSAHGIFLHEGVHWSNFFPAAWAAVPSQRRVLVVNSCRAAIFTGDVRGDPAPHLSIASTGREEDGWSGLEEEGLPIIGEVFTYYFVDAFTDPEADADGNGAVSIQEAALRAEEQQSTYMHEVVFAVPEFEEAFRNAGFPIDKPTYPNVVVDDAIGEPVYLDLDVQ